MKRQILWTALLVLACFGIAQAQGTQTGVITGQAQSADGLAFPGVSVTVKSPALQGVRTATTDANGGYIFKALPTGKYTVTFEVAGMQKVEKKVDLELGRTMTVDGTLQVGSVEEEVTVTAEAPGILETTSGGANYKAEEIDTLATGRTVAAIAELAPGLTDNTFNAGQVTIAGGFAYDNVFLVDGVDVNDNVYGTANNLFIEEAIEETQVLTSAVSAEFGRFGGGVINTVTKRGGNEFSGSFRVNFTNTGWTDETPYEDSKGIERKGDTNRTYEATLGGPVVKDKLWFFLAGRRAFTGASNTFPDLGAQWDSVNENQRIIAKLTGTFAQNHTLTANYVNNATDQTTASFGMASTGTRSIDPRTIYSRSLPNSLIGVTYTGLLASNLFLEAQYSQKKFQFKNSGGSNTNLVDGSPYFTLGIYGPGAGGHYNAPYWDATDPEDRDNRQIAGSLSYFLSTGSFGRHDLKMGYENFRTKRTGGNSQTPTDYVFYADYLSSGGVPVLSNGRYQPIWVGGENVRVKWVATRGAELKITTQSFFINDVWQITPKISANIGARFEMVDSDATGKIQAIDTKTLVPRLALSYDVKGDGKIKLDASYAKYAGKYNDTQIGNNTNVGNPAYLYQYYVGPDGIGYDFAPAMDHSNWVTFGGAVPTVNIQMDPELHSPTTNEFTVAAGFALPKNGYFKVMYTNRQFKDFIESFTDTTTGNSTAILEGLEVGPFDNVVYKNSNLPTRKYQGVTVQASIRPVQRWNVSGNYTIQLKNEGDFQGEGTNTPGISSAWGDYPGLYVMERNNPYGRLAGFQRHKARAWTSYDFSMGKFGSMTPSILWRFDSALTYSLSAAKVPFSSWQRAQIAGQGYVSPPTNQTLYFSERGEFDFDNYHAFDFALNYSVPVFKNLRPWFKFEVYNLLNNDKLVTWNTTVTRNSAGPVDQYGLATQYIKGSNFGKGTGTGNYITPRTIQFAVGFRF